MTDMTFRIREDMIVSRQNRRIVSLCKLSERKEREAMGLFRFDGIKLLCEAVRRGVSLHSVYLRQGSQDKVVARMSALYGLMPAEVACDVFLVEAQLFDRISEENSPEGVICVAKHIDKCHKMYTINREGFPLPPAGPLLLLESVRDPGNVGTIIRTAAALGVAQLILSRDCADLYNPRTVRAAMGALFSLPVARVDDLPGAVRALRAAGRLVNAAALDENAVRLGDVVLSQRYENGREVLTSAGGPCAVIGNEGHGLSPEVMAACDRTVYIPMMPGEESLNAAVAAALLMWDMCRSEHLR